MSMCGALEKVYCEMMLCEACCAYETMEPLPSKDVLVGYCELMAPTVGPMVMTLRGTVRLACVCV